MAKCMVDLVTGFLASGKTSLINSILEKSSSKDEIVVVQCEKGVEKITLKITNKNNIAIKDFSSNDELTEERVLRLVRFYSPTRLIIECNGVGDVKRIVELLNSKALRPYIRVGAIANLVDVTTLNMFFKNIPLLIMPNLQTSNLIILNKCNNISDGTVKEYISMIETLNLHAHIVTCGDKNELKDILGKSTIINRLLG